MEDRPHNQNKDNDDESIDGSTLCCCEYYNRNGERFHILECCCNCVDFDKVFDRIICCRSVNSKNCYGMLLTFQDRLRIPWQGGAKQISMDTIIPIFTIPFIFGIAALNKFTAIIMGFSTISFLAYSYYCLRRTISRTRFFLMWSIWSVIYMLILFEMTVPLLEILPEENYTLVALIICALFCFYKTKTKSQENIVLQNLGLSRVDLPDIDEEQTTVLIDNDDGINDEHANICQHCRKYVQSRTFHCLICQSCIIKRDHHSHFLNCCIGGANHCYYYFGLWLAMMSFFLGTNLTLTSVCHPLLIFTVFGIHILVPDDCTEVFDQYEMGLAFIVAIYSFIAGLFLLIVILVQSYLIANGVTLSEWGLGMTGNRKKIFWNIKMFLFTKN